MPKEEFLIAQRGFTSKIAVLSITAKVEIEPNSYPKDIILLTYKLYSGDIKVSLLFDANSLRALAYGCREIVAKEKTDSASKEHKNYEVDEEKKYDFFKFTESVKDGVRYRKQIQLVVEKNRFYINFKEKNVKTKEVTKEPQGFALDQYGLLAFADTITIMADELDRAFYKIQRSRPSSKGS
jgi:hypothetical protein